MRRSSKEVNEWKIFLTATWAEVNIDNILHNVRVIKDTLTEIQKIIAVVKADAYGHGAVAVAKALEKETDMFALSSIDEVVQLRNAGVRGDMLILGYTPSQFAKSSSKRKNHADSVFL